MTDCSNYKIYDIILKNYKISISGGAVLKKKLVSMLLIFIFSLLILPVNILQAQAASLKEQGIIRVKVSAGSSGTTTVKSEGNYILGENTTIVLTKDKNYTVCLSGNNVQLKNESGTVLYEGATVTLKQYSVSSGDNYIYVKRDNDLFMKYQGDMVFKKYSTALGVYNYVNMEKYLEGVLAAEVGESWPMEALKAQAVAARSYAYSYLLEAGDYDVVDTTDNQVYYGYNPDNVNIAAAVKATSRQVLFYGGKIAKAYFSASNGGQTELTSNVWGGTVGYITMKDDPYDIRSTIAPSETLYFPKTNSGASTDTKFWVSKKPSYSATEKIADQNKLENYLKSKIAASIDSSKYSALTNNITVLGAVSVTTNTKKYPSCASSIYYTKLQVVLSVRVKKMSGTVVTSSTEDIQVTLDFSATDLRNKSFSSSRCMMPIVTSSDSGFTLVYRRWGHGIGMSQYGAYQMAKESKDYKFILDFYYTGTNLVTLTYPDFSIPTSTATIPATTSSPTTTPPAQVNGEDVVSGTVGKVVNVSNSVNVRSGAGTGYTALGTAKLNSTWTVTKKNITGTDGAYWQQITYNGKIGYIRYNYIQLTEPTAATATPTPTGLGESVATGTTGKVINVTTSVNVRSGAGTSYSALGTAKLNSTWTITKKNIVGTDKANWHQITYNGKTGYIRYNYIQLIEPAATATPSPTQATVGESVPAGTTGKVINVKTSVNVRSGAGTSYSALGTAKLNSTWSVTKQNVVGTDKANWYQITYNGKTGYIRYNYFQIVAASSTTTPTPTTTASLGTALASGSKLKIINVSSSVNVRSGPGTTYSCLGTAKLNTTWTAAKKDVKGTDSASWYEISYNGKTGYVRYNYGQIVTESSASSSSGQSLASNAKAKVINVTTSVNVRSGPGTNYSALGTAKLNSTWTAVKKNVIGTDGANWYQIIYNGKTGYIRYNYISLI